MFVEQLIPEVPAIMGILNVTPDSFSDGGSFFSKDDALRHAEYMCDSGADIIDIGGESTRPGSESVSLEEELRRVIPVIKAVKKELDVRVSCDTQKPEVAAEAISAGADMINDVSGFRDPLMRKNAAESGAVICIMHMSGRPSDMQESPSYKDVCGEISDFLHTQAEICEEEGVSRESILLDPGIGFGKTLENNLEIMANISVFADKYPVLIGASRKSFIYRLLGIPVEERLPASLASGIYCIMNSASILRVHDVKETREALDIIKALGERKHE